MQYYNIKTPEQALVYITDCTLATVSSMAMLKRRSKREYERQIEIAQKSINWIRSFQIDVGNSRIRDIFDTNMTVREWAKQFEVNK